MRIILFLSVLTFSILNGRSQNVLELTNAQSGKTRIIKSGAKLFYKTKYDSSFVKGKIMQIKDSMVVIYLSDYDEGTPVADIPLKDLTEIKKATTFHAISRSVASVMLPAGALLLGTGLTSLGRNDSYKGQSSSNDDQAKAYTFSGLGLIAGGVIPFVIKQKTYDLRKSWTVAVKKMTQK